MGDREDDTGTGRGLFGSGTSTDSNIDNYRTFRSNPLERLGIQNEDFKETLNQIAFTSPANYFKIRSVYSNYLLKNVVKLLHSTVYFALTSGITVNEKAEPNRNILIVQAAAEATTPEAIGGIPISKIRPSIPSETADKIAMDIVLTLKDSIQEDIIDRIFSTEQIDRAFATQARRAELEINTT